MGANMCKELLNPHQNKRSEFIEIFPGNGDSEPPNYDIVFLSSFQVKKMSAMFDQIFQKDPEEKDASIDCEDIRNLTQRVRKCSEWEEGNEQLSAIEEMCRVFYECLLDQIRKDTGIRSAVSITREQWLKVWDNLSDGAVSLQSYPIWAQELPKILFTIMDKNSDKKISKEELQDFFRDFLEISINLEEKSEKAFNSMTENGDYELDYDIYIMNFTNFLLGKTTSGPGKYVFGIGDLGKVEAYSISMDLNKEEK